jgi:hypothetical protein
MFMAQQPPEVPAASAPQASPRGHEGVHSEQREHSRDRDSKPDRQRVLCRPEKLGTLRTRVDSRGGRRGCSAWLGTSPKVEQVGATTADQHKSYFSVSVDPGEHHLSASVQSIFSIASRLVGLAHFTAEAGQVDYFPGRGLGQKDQALLDFEPIGSDQGKLFVAAYPLSISHPRQ